MEWVFPIAFAIAFIYTKKDLALVCAAVGLFSAAAFTFCDPESWTYEQMLMINMALNLILGIVSYAHWMNARQPLARAMIWIASVAIASNLCQVFSDSDFFAHFLTAVQFSALIAILKLDGRKEYMNDLAANVLSIIGSMGSGNSGIKGGKG